MSATGSTPAETGTVPASAGRRRRVDSPEANGRHQRRPLALVTGATSGIGLAVAHDLAADHDLILVARTASDLTDLAALLSEESSATIRTLALDLTDDAALVEKVESLNLDCLDVLVHSAGVEASGEVSQLDPARWRSVLDLDLVAVAELTRLTLPALRRRRGLVVFVNSGAGLRAWPGQSLYCAAKAGLKAFADTLREEERGRVRVTTIYPGRVDTPMQKRLHRDKAQRLREAGREAPRYRPADHMTPTSVAATIRLAVSIPLDAVVEDLAIRPAGML